MIIVGINFDDHHEALLVDYEVWLNSAKACSAVQHDRQRCERNTASLQCLVEVDLWAGAK